MTPSKMTTIEWRRRQRRKSAVPAVASAASTSSQSALRETRPREVRRRGGRTLYHNREQRLGLLPRLCRHQPLLVSPLWMNLFHLLFPLHSSLHCCPDPRRRPRAPTRTCPRAADPAQSRSSTCRWLASGSAAAAPERTSCSPRGRRVRRGRGGRWSGRGRRGQGEDPRPRPGRVAGTSGAGPTGGHS